jgi:hypothetical protein
VNGGPGAKPVPDVVRDLVRAVLALLASTARMLRVEARDVARRAGRRLALLVASATIAAAGLLLLLGGAAFLLEGALGFPRWAAFATVGACALAAGAVGVSLGVRRLASEDLLFPATCAELEKDLHAATAPPPEDRP